MEILELRKSIYGNLVKAMDQLELQYDKLDDELSVRFKYSCEGMTTQLRIRVVDGPYAVNIFGILPFDVRKSSRAEIANAVCRINSTLYFGHFDYDMEKDVSFSLAHLYGDHQVLVDDIDSLIRITLGMISRYGELLFAVNKGYIKAEDVLNHRKADDDDDDDSSDTEMDDDDDDDDDDE